MSKLTDYQIEELYDLWQITSPGLWRTGSKVGRTLYDGDGPDDLIGVMDKRTDAMFVARVQVLLPTLLREIQEHRKKCEDAAMRYYIGKLDTETGKAHLFADEEDAITRCQTKYPPHKLGELVKEDPWYAELHDGTDWPVVEKEHDYNKCYACYTQ